HTPRVAATSSAVACVSPTPSPPVHAFAPQEWSTPAASRPSRTTCCDHRTGAALTRFLVKTAAAALVGPSLTINATSRPASLMPAARPAARKPWAGVTLIARPRRPRSWRNPAHRQPRGLVQAKHEIRALDGLPSRSLAEVVDRRADGGAARAGVDSCLQVAGVGAKGRFGVRPAPLGEDVQERFGSVGAREYLS